MKRFRKSEKFFLFTYFILLILIGTIILKFPASWDGKKELEIVDAFFTATSAVCVTGLITVDTSQYSILGKIVIMILIQAGGLGIISFSTIYLALPAKRISLRNRTAIREYYLDAVETEPIHIIRQIIIITFLIELVGAILLFIGFYADLGDSAIFYSIFHSISAFCNAGFSLFSNNLENYSTSIIINVVVMILIILGGIGFVVLRDIGKRMAGKRKRFTLHTKIVLLATIVLISGGALLYYAFETNNTYRNMSFGEKILASFFQATTPRTAGFNTIPQAKLSAPSKAATLPLMFIGGSAGSAAGGVKVTTFFIVLLIALGGLKRRGSIILANRKIPNPTIWRAVIFLIKAFLILWICTFLLTITELNFATNSEKDFYSIIFESFSAFGTVGLSMGITSSLSFFGKIVIIFTMFAGRVGLISMAIPATQEHMEKIFDYPNEEVLIG